MLFKFLLVKHRYTSFNHKSLGINYLMSRNILLLEPNYKNKYPPIGLMKLSTYHKKLGDNVTFFKGELQELILNDLYLEIEKKLNKIDFSIQWALKKVDIIKFIKTNNKKSLELISSDLKNYKGLVLDTLKYYRNYYHNKEYLLSPKYDRVCITTLFTFYWDKTIETIEFAKSVAKSNQEIHIGGVMASVLTEEIKNQTGIIPYSGLLDKPGILDDNEIIIDELLLDYSILDEIDYKYPESDGYYGYMTRGCKRTCAFCAVPKLEPNYKSYINLIDNINEVKEKFGEQRNLLLLDNNVLASKDFSRIIEEIKEAGFYKGAKFIEPNYLDIAMKNLQDSVNDKAYIRKLHELLHSMLKKLKNEKQQFFYDKLKEFHLINFEMVTKENLLKVYPFIKDIYEQYRNKASKLRYVDFNQGVDARYLTEEKVKLLSEIPIRPLRIAFDSINYHRRYDKAVRQSAQYGIKHLSNYLLYNYDDKPEELYERMKINVELCDELDIRIYSFPMKYIPIHGEVSKNRNFVGEHWNKKFVRAIQAILNSTKGKIGRGKSFFYKAFGENLEEFNKLLYMPETYIIYRLKFENNGNVDRWWNSFNSLNDTEKQSIMPYILSNDFNNSDIETMSDNVKKLIAHYHIKKQDVLNY